MNPIGNLIYLASPSYHKSEFVIHKRYEMARDATMAIMKEGRIVYSPIVHMHHIQLISDFLKDWDFYKKYDECMLSRCNEMWILNIDGWKHSKGVKGEIDFALKNNIVI